MTDAMPTIALLAFPVFALILFRALGPVQGTIWVTLIGYLFLPESFVVAGLSPAVLPDYTKYTAIAYCLVLGHLLFAARDPVGVTPKLSQDALFRGVLFTFFAVLVVSPVFTMLDNRFSIVVGEKFRPALTLRDVISMNIEIIFLLIPFIAAWRWLRTPERHAMLLTALMIMGFVYTFLVLFELRMSPQLNRWIYGYFPHSWVQHLRGGGFRPLVFLNHGLEVGFFLFMAVIASFAMARQGLRRSGTIALLIGCWTFGVLFMSHNLGATMIAFMFSAVVLFLTVRLQIRVAALVAIAFLAFPAVRQAELVRYDGFLSAVSTISPQRAASLEFRLRNEDALLQRAYQKPVFGWGGWTRAQIFDDRGRLISVTDGIWIIVLGERGWVGYLALFGLFCLPMLWLLRAMRRKTISPATVGLSLIGAGNLIYMIPNATLTPVCLLVFGALAGFAQTYPERSDETSEHAPSEGDSRRVRYSRFGPKVAPTASARLQPSGDANNPRKKGAQFRREGLRRSSSVTRE